MKRKFTLFCLALFNVLFVFSQTANISSNANCLPATLTSTGVPYVNNIGWYKNNSLVASDCFCNYSSTIAGGNGAGSGLNQLNGPGGVFYSGNGYMYVADANNNRVLRYYILGSTPVNGIVVAGGNGAGSAPNQLHSPVNVFVDAFNNIYVSDNNNYRVQKWSAGADTGITVAGGKGFGSSQKQLTFTSGLYVDNAGNVYVADNSNNRVQKWTANDTIGTTVAGGNGAGSGLNQLNGVEGIYMYNGFLYIADGNNNRIMKWSLGSSSGTIVAGGNGSGAGLNQLKYPTGVWLDNAGSMYITDRSNNRVVKWAFGSNQGQIIAGGKGLGLGDGQLNFPWNVCGDGLVSYNFYISDAGNNRIVKVPITSISQTYNASSFGSYKAIVQPYDIGLGVSAAQTTNTITFTDITPTINAGGSTIICNGGSVTLTSSSLTGNQWLLNGLPINGATSNTYAATQAGNFSVEVTINGCSAKSTAISVSVVAAPALTIIADSTNLCQGGSVKLIAAATGGPALVYQYQLTTKTGTGSLVGYTSTSSICDCPVGYVAVGYRGNSGAWMDKLGLICKKLNTDGTLDTALVYANTFGAPDGAGNGNITSGNLLATGNNMLTGIYATTNSYTSYGDYMSSVSGITLPASSIANSISTGIGNVSQLGPTGIANGTFTVPAGNVIVGMEGYSTPNKYVAGFKLRYVPLIKSLSNGTYTWSTGSNLSSITVSPALGNTNYSVNFSQTNGCTVATAQTTITVNPITTPSVSLSPNSNNLTYDSTVTFTATATNEGSAPNFVYSVNGYQVQSGSSNTYTSNLLQNGDVISCRLTSNAPCVTTQTVTNSKYVNINGNNPSQWLDVGRLPFTGTVGVKLAVNASSKPFVYFMDGMNNNKGTVKQFTGTNWENVGDTAILPSNGEIAFSPEGILYVCGFVDTSTRITVMRFVNGSWQNVGNIASMPYNSYDNKISFSHDGTPYVGFIVYDYTIYKSLPNVMHFDGTNWVYTGTPNFNNSGLSFFDFKMSPTDTPYIVMADRSQPSEAITCMKFDGSNWVFVGPKGFSTCGYYVSIEFSPDGTPYVCGSENYNPDGNRLKVSVLNFNGLSWQTVGGQYISSDLTYTPKLLMLPSNQPVVIYRKIANNSQPFLNYIMARKFENGSWSQIGGQVSSTVNAFYPTISLSSKGDLYAAYTNGSASTSFVKQFIGAIIPCSTNYWTGTVSTAWENPANWNCGIVPDINTSVIINPGAPFYPLISTNVSIKSLKVDPNVNFTIKAGYNLTIAGN